MVDLSDLGPSQTPPTGGNAPAMGGIDLSDLGPSYGQDQQTDGGMRPSIGNILKTVPGLFSKGGPLETPWSRLSDTFPQAAEAGAEQLGKMGVGPKTSAALMLPVSMAPSMVAAYGALPSSVQNSIAGNAGQFMKPLSSEVGAIGGAAEGGTPPVPTPPSSPAPMLQPNYLQQTGGAGLNAQLGIRGSTIQKLTQAGQNPGTVGINLAKSLQEQGAVGSNPIESWDNVNRLLQGAGQDVGNAKTAIANEAAKFGAVDNPLEVDSDKALKPLYDAWKGHAQTITGAGKDVAPYFEDAHKGLTQLAQQQGGTLNLDNIDQALSEVGPVTHSGAEISQHAYQQLYGTLADVRDSMVKQVADQANNPSLAADLLSANKKYSQLIRIMPDVGRASANSSTGQKSLMQLWTDLQNSVINRGGMAIGSSVPSPSQASSAGSLFKGGLYQGGPQQQ